MKVDHIRFYVEDAAACRNWLVEKLGFRAIAREQTNDSYLEVVQAGTACLVLGSPKTNQGDIATFLQHHPPGVADLAFWVPDLAAAIRRAEANAARLLQPVQTVALPNGRISWVTIAACGDLTHTLIERTGPTFLLPSNLARTEPSAVVPLEQAVESGTVVGSHSPRRSPIHPQEALLGIDHIVLNVAAGSLDQTVAWYEAVLGLQPDQEFQIETAHSALRSRVMRHPSGNLQLPINEPTSATSQIQEFLEWNGGPGIQHLALEVRDLPHTIGYFHSQGLSTLPVPSAYYAQLRQQAALVLPEDFLQQLEANQLLIDWQDSPATAVLLQTFTQPIFPQPTFFFELIERQVDLADGVRCRAQGFGERNFRALFEAIEREQMKRGSLLQGDRAGQELK